MVRPVTERLSPNPWVSGVCRSRVVPSTSMLRSEQPCNPAWAEERVGFSLHGTEALLNLLLGLSTTAATQDDQVLYDGDDSY